MRVVVTGGTGFIGRALVRELLSRGHQVLQIGRSPVVDAQGSEHHLQANLIDLKSYAKALADYEPEVACHLAWEGIPDFSTAQCERNLIMGIHFIDALMAIGSCRKLIGVGSCWEYGLQTGVCLENTPPTVTNDFTWAKDSIRRFGMMKAARTGKLFGWFRLFYVYGPGQRKGALIPSTVEACRRKEEVILSNPHAAQDFVYLGDVVNALVRAVELDWPSGEYNIGTGILTPVADLVRMVKILMNDPMKEVVSNAGVTTGGGTWASTERTRRQLQWHFCTAIGEGLRKTLAQELLP